MLKEIEIVQSEIDRYDSNGLTVKGWCLAVWAGAIAYGIEHHQPIVVATSLVTAMSFAVVELMYRRFQLRFVLRSKRLEEMLSSGDLSAYEYDVHRSATGQRGDCSFGTELKAVLKQPQFTVFYLILSTFAVVCTIYAHYWLKRVVGDLNV